MLRRTPCIGICSTTYGDLVCRGCKRFAHEIVQWNAFDPDQRRAVWRRLLSLRSGAVYAVLEIRDETRLRDGARRLGLSADDDADPANVLYELLQRLQWREVQPSIDELGARALAAATDSGGRPVDPAPASLLAAIDREFYLRSVAQYERDYRIPAE